jgi:MoaA/NifB/PqqE/SkfB family radical SAM enzyme
MEDRLKEIIISITNRCNLRCAMCQIPGSGVQEEMTTEKIKELILDAVKLCPASLVFSGGEPLLRNDIYDLISFANRKKINTCLTSNGILIDDSVAKRLADSGIGVVNISIEGPEKVHESMRGTGNFNKAVEALNRLCLYKIETTIATVVCRKNYKSLPEVMDLARSHGVTTVKFQPFSDIFLVQKQGKADFFLSQSERSAIEQSVEEVIKRSLEYKISTNPVEYLRAIPAYLCGCANNGARIGCAALWTSCPISARGDVYPCWVLSDRILGNVKDVRLSSIWNSFKHNRMRESILAGDCPGCLMSCYDYNLGKYGSKHTFIFKVQKLKKIKFDKRLYYRVYQNAKYVVKKMLNRASDILASRLKSDQGADAHLWEIREEKNRLKKVLERFKDE